MLVACNANNHVYSANCMRPMQEPSRRSMYSDAAGHFGAEPSVAVHFFRRTAGGLRLFCFWAANEVLIFLHVSSVDMDGIHFE
jgi:hypothetical protein